MPQLRFRPSRKQIIILAISIGLLILVMIAYRLISLWQPDQSLLTLLPDVPMAYLSVKDLGGLVETFQRSEFGRQTAQMPLLAEIQKERWWRQLVYQKRLWEYEVGGKLDLKKIRGYFGEEAILSFYDRGGEITFLLVSVVGAKEKLEIATLTATDVVNPKYKRLKEDYRGLDINTITGYPRDFSYAFIGKIGVLSTDSSLIQEMIDIQAKRKDSFTDVQAIGDYLREQYNTGQNTVYIDYSRLVQRLMLGEPLKSLLRGVSVWTFSNHYQEGSIYSRHRVIGSSDWRIARGKPSSRSIDKRLLSILPSTTAFLGANGDVDLMGLWTQIRTNFPLQYRPSGIELSRYLKPEVTLALLPSSTGAPALIPPALFICPIADRNGLETALMKLKTEKITFNGKPLQFLDAQNHQGVELHPVQLRLGFLLSLKGGYALLDDYWVIGTTIGALKSAIDAFADGEGTLVETMPPGQMDLAGTNLLLIQPNYLVPELRRLSPLARMISTSGREIDPKLIKRLTDNLFPLQAIGPITAAITFDDDYLDSEVQIVLEK